MFSRRGVDGDPFVGAQEIETFDITVRASGPAKAAATVAFTNSGKPKMVELDVVKLEAGWRINDVRWDSGTLRGLYAKK